MAHARKRLGGTAIPDGAERCARRAPARTIGLCSMVIAAPVRGLAAPGGGLPPPPENPTDDRIAARQHQAARINSAVGELSARVADRVRIVSVRTSDHIGASRPYT